MGMTSLRPPTSDPHRKNYLRRQWRGCARTLPHPHPRTCLLSSLTQDLSLRVSKESAWDLPQEAPWCPAGRPKARSGSLFSFTMSLALREVVCSSQEVHTSTYLNQSVKVGQGDGGLETWALHLGASGRSGSWMLETQAPVPRSPTASDRAV